MNTYFVYILASRRNGTLYIGLTNNLRRRIEEHKTGLIPGFTNEYRVHTLVYFESHHNVHDAISREKQIKKWNRRWKLNLIEQQNPTWQDLYDQLP